MSEVPQISCQLSFYPLGTDNYNSIINQVLQIIDKQTTISAETNDFATILRGPGTNIFKLI